MISHVFPPRCTRSAQATTLWDCSSAKRGHPDPETSWSTVTGESRRPITVSGYATTYRRCSKPAPSSTVSTSRGRARAHLQA
jgi:hypothetical protein